MENNRQTLKSELSCGCGHCTEHGDTADVLNENYNFIKEYGFSILKIIISVIFWVVARFVSISDVLQLIFFITAAFVVGYELLYDFAKGIIKGKLFDENTLMVIASISAFVLGEYSEGAVVLILFVIGELLEKIATGNSRRKIAGLAQLKTSVVRLITKNGITEVPPDEIRVGSLLQNRRGDRIPIDGILLDKNAIIDMKAITGESKYYEVQSGEKILSGGINIGEAIVIRTTKSYTESTAQKIISLVEGSLSKKAKSQKFISKFAKFYTPIIVCLGVLIALIPPLFQDYNFSTWIYKALSFIVISCPCSLVISVPLSFFVGIGSLAKHGVLVKGSSYIETLSNVNSIAFDKTGTLTSGEFVVENIITFNDFSKEVAIDYACEIEKYSNHPISKAFLKLKTRNNVVAENVKELSGKGIFCEIDNKSVIIGNLSLMNDYFVEVKKSSYVGTVLDLAVDGKLVCEFHLCDTTKNSAKSAVENLKRLGINNLSIISGDKKEIVKEVADYLGIANYYGELLPEEKLNVTEKIKENNNSLLYVGDGINDAPVLSISDVGVAMGGIGSDVAIETADVVVMDDDLNKIPLFIKHSKKVKKIVLSNIIASIFVKSAIMALSVIINLPIWLALFADVGVMLLAVLNSLRCYNVKKIPD